MLCLGKAARIRISRITWRHVAQLYTQVSGARIIQKIVNFFWQNSDIAIFNSLCYNIATRLRERKAQENETLRNQDAH